MNMNAAFPQVTTTENRKKLACVIRYSAPQRRKFIQEQRLSKTQKIVLDRKP